MKKILLLLVPILLLVFITVSYLIIFLQVDKFDRKSIINKFSENKEYFNQVVEELKESHDMNLSMGYIDIITAEENHKIYPSNEEQFHKYQKTWNLKEKLSVKEIGKEDENIYFMFDSNVRKACYIVYLIDEKDWKNAGYSILYRKQLDGHWYYIEAN